VTTRWYRQIREKEELDAKGEGEQETSTTIGKSHQTLAVQASPLRARATPAKSVQSVVPISEATRAILRRATDREYLISADLSAALLHLVGCDQLTDVSALGTAGVSLPGRLHPSDGRECSRQREAPHPAPLPWGRGCECSRHGEQAQPVGAALEWWM